MNRAAPARRRRAAITPKGLARLVRDTKIELQKVTWPTRREALNLTLVVIGLAVFLGIILGTVDYVLSRLITAII
jgi:preprotein translocase subunit SecE